MRNTQNIQYYPNKLRSYSLKPSFGFTLIELIVSVSVFLVIIGFSGLAYLNIQKNSDLVNQSTQFVSSIRQAQALAISGQSLDESNNVSVGIHIEESSYTLFIGNTYNLLNESNIVTNLPQNITIDNNLPSADLIFSARSGEIIDFDTQNNTIIITHQDGQSKTITINKLGVVDIE